MSAAVLNLAGDVVELAPYVPMTMGSPAPLRELAFRRDVWLPEDLDRMREMFAADASLDEIATAVGRTRAALQTKLYDLGLRRSTNRPWTELEDLELAQRYGHESVATIAASLGRAVTACYARAAALGLAEEAPPPFDPWEDLQIRKGYAAGVPVAQLAALIGRTYSSVNSRAYKLRIRHAAQPDDWSNEERARALELADAGHRYLKIIELLVADGFPRRTKSGLGQVLRKMGYGRGWGRDWTPEEDELLRQAYAQSASLTPLRDRLNRSVYSIRWRSGELGLRGTHGKHDGFRQGPVWSDEETARLKEAYGKVRTKDLALELGRPLGGIYQRAWDLGLKHPWMRAFSADEDRAIAIAWRHGVSLTDLALATGRDIAVVAKHAIRLGLAFDDPARPAKAKRSRRAGRPTLTLQDILAIEAP